MTSITTLLVVVAMYLFGGELIHAFSQALIVGILVGTYSSIYVASSTTVALNITRESLMPVEKEGANQEGQYIE
jgi:preprotein translocase subunit SecF